MPWESTVTMRAVQQGPRARSMSSKSSLEASHEVEGTIARRAFELFLSRRGQNGCDIDDWLRAESELIHPSHIDVEDCDEAIVVRAEVPGFRSDELRFCVEPFRITIVGAREISGRPIFRKMLYSDRCANQVFRVIDCPIELNFRNTTSSLKEGILQLDIPKAYALPIVSIEAAAHWILRAEDHRRWAAVFQRPADNRNSSRQREVSLAL
jgi:HSP20 family molecular chaperone IbpA